jgi:hypothetical protein
LTFDKRKITDFLGLEKLVEVSLSELSRIKRGEFACVGLVFIIPSVTISSDHHNREVFYSGVKEEYFLWNRQLRAHIGNRGLRTIKKGFNSYKIKVLFSGIWVIDGEIYLRPIGEMLEKIKT